MTPTRSPLGAFYRSPLGVRGGAAAIYTNPLIPKYYGSAKMVSADNHFMALVGTRLYTWGNNMFGQLGNGTKRSSSNFQDIGTGWIKISAAINKSFGIKANGDLYAWGSNENGGLGNGGVGAEQLTPYLVSGGWSDVSGRLGITLGLKGNNLYAWGIDFVDYGNSPSFIMDGVTAISAGDTFLACLKGDELYLWGENVYGQLGFGDYDDRTTPTYHSSGWLEISASGGSHAVALKTNGDLYAWGDNSSGQVGDGTRTERNAPVKIGEGYDSVRCGVYHSLALKGSELWSWGSSYGGATWRSGDMTIPGLVGKRFEIFAGGENGTIAVGSVPLFLSNT